MPKLVVACLAEEINFRSRNYEGKRCHLRLFLTAVCLLIYGAWYFQLSKLWPLKDLRGNESSCKQLSLKLHIPHVALLNRYLITTSLSSVAVVVFVTVFMALLVIKLKISLSGSFSSSTEKQIDFQLVPLQTKLTRKTPILSLETRRLRNSQLHSSQWCWRIAAICACVAGARENFPELGGIEM